MSKRARESFATSAGALIARDKLREQWATRMPTWTVAQYLHLNIKLEATLNMEICVSQILKELTQRRHEHQAPDNWKLQEHQAPGDQLQEKIYEVERKFIFAQILMERNASINSTIPQRISGLQSEDKHEIHNKPLNSECAKFGQDPTNLQDFALNVF